MQRFNLFIRRFFAIEEERRFRMIWRLVLQSIVMLAFVLIVSLIIGIGVGVAYALGLGELDFSFADPASASAVLVQNPVFLSISSMGTTIAIVGSVVIAAWLFDRRPLADFGLRLDGPWWRDLAFGLLLGALLMGGIFAVELALGWLAIDGFMVSRVGLPIVPLLLAGALTFLSVGIYEEVLFRGYYLPNLAQGLNKLKFLAAPATTWIAWLVTSGVFGLAHASNPNATLISSLNIAVAGILLGVGYILTGRMGVPIGVHITWNYFQGYVFGLPVSGNPPSGSIIAITQLGPDIMTGGPFGPEAGVIGLIAIALGVGLTVLYVKFTEGEVHLHLPIAAPRELNEKERAKMETAELDTAASEDIVLDE